MTYRSEWNKARFLTVFFYFIWMIGQEFIKSLAIILIDQANTNKTRRTDSNVFKIHPVRESSVLPKKKALDSAQDKENAISVMLQHGRSNSKPSKAKSKH